MSDLLPCPFCGGEARLFCDDLINGVPVEAPDWVIECEGDCTCRFSMADQDRFRLIAAWNRRAPVTLAAALALPEIKALVEALKMAQVWLDFDGRFDMQTINAALRRIAEARHE